MRARVAKLGGRWAWACECGRESKRSGFGVWHVAHRAALRHVIDKHSTGGAVGEVSPVRSVPTRQRYGCTVVGCNPVLWGEEARDAHVEETGHRARKWPERTKDGERKARQRSRSGYYNKYNKGAKAYRPGRRSFGSVHGDHPFSPEALGQE